MIKKAPLTVKSMKLIFYLGIALLTTVFVAPLYTYVVAHNIVADAVNKLSVDSGSPFPIHVGVTNVLYAENFLFTNKASIPLIMDNLNIAVYITNSTASGDQYVLGSMLTMNQTVKANREIGIPISFNVTSEDALSLIRGSGYHVGWKVEITASGSYLFWHFTKQKIVTIGTH